MSTSGKSSAIAKNNGQPPPSRRILYFVVFGLVIAAIVGLTVLLIYGDIVGRLSSEVRRVAKAVAPGVTVSTFASLNNDRVFPIGIAPAPDGTFYLSLFGTGAIQKIQPDGTILNWNQVTAGGALATAPDGGLYVIDYSAADARASGHLIRIAPDGTKSAVGGSALPQLPLFAQLAVDPAGNVYVSHDARAEIWRVTPEGVAAVWWAVPPVGQTKALPAGVAYDALHRALLVADAGTGTIYRVELAASGTPNSTPLYRQNGLDVRTLTVDEKGRVLIAYWKGDGGVLARLEEDGSLTTLAQDFRHPLGLLYRAGAVYVVNSDLPGLIQQIRTHPPFTVDRVTLPSSTE